jgi:GntR family transcriptional regulator/MocR family aminotransferase
VDEEGIVDDAPCDYYYVTRPPGADRGGDEQARRGQLLEHAARHDAVIIEDDYDSESNFMLNPLPALKASDRSGRVITSAACQKRCLPACGWDLWWPTRT